MGGIVAFMMLFGIVYVVIMHVLVIKCMCKYLRKS